MTRIISNQDVEQLVTMEDCIEAMDRAQEALAEGEAINGPIYRVMTPRDPRLFAERGSPQATGEADHDVESDYPLHHTYTSLTGAIKPFNVTCDRIDSDGVYYVEDEDGIKEVRVPLSRDNHFCGLMMLWDSNTGEPLAFIHDAVAQKMRVAATSALGTKYLAREEVNEMALIGSGWQASTQIQAHPVVRDLDVVRVYSQTPEHRREFVEEWSGQVSCNVVETSSTREAVEGADIVVTATNSIDPVVRDDWIDDGVFFTGVKDLEFETSTYERSDKIFVNRHGAFWERYAIGGEDVIPEEGRDMAQKGVVVEDHPLIGEIPAGITPGRESPNELIGLINKGDGVQFAAVANRIYREAESEDIGREIPTELFLQGEEYIP